MPRCDGRRVLPPRPPYLARTAYRGRDRIASRPCVLARRDKRVRRGARSGRTSSVVHHDTLSAAGPWEPAGGCASVETSLARTGEAVARVSVVESDQHRQQRPQRAAAAAAARGRLWDTISGSHWTLENRRGKGRTAMTLTAGTRTAKRGERTGLLTTDGRRRTRA